MLIDCCLFNKDVVYPKSKFFHKTNGSLVYILLLMWNCMASWVPSITYPFNMYDNPSVIIEVKKQHSKAALWHIYLEYTFSADAEQVTHTFPMK